MAGTAPIQIGSASTTGFIFQSGSAATTDKYGIQTCDVKALFPRGDSVYSTLPSEGSSFSSVFGNSYLPSGFLLDFFEGAPGVEYQDATVAKVSFKFKRIDPLFTNRRIVSVDSVVNYDNNILSQIILWTGGIAQKNIFGFPDPTTLVTYSTTVAPNIGGGGLSNIYALPGDIRTQGFPDVPDIAIPFTFFVAPGAAITYWDGSTFHQLTVSVRTVFIFNINLIANPRGWQLTKLKYDPIANRNFFAVEENWRNFYSLFGVTLASRTP